MVLKMDCSKLNFHFVVFKVLSEILTWKDRKMEETITILVKGNRSPATIAKLGMMRPDIQVKVLENVSETLNDSKVMHSAEV
jgi:hypothetical protein